MDQSIAINTLRLKSFEDLNNAVTGTNRTVEQIGRGRIHGYLTHLSIYDLPISVGEFSVGVRSRGIPNDNNISIGTLTGCTDKVTRWSREMYCGDVIVTPPGVEHDARYLGGASFVAISLSPASIFSFFASEPQLQDMKSWRMNIFRPQSDLDGQIKPRLSSVLARLQDPGVTLTIEAAAFWRRSIIETMTTTVLNHIANKSDSHLPSAAKIVRKLEDYVSRSKNTPIHISEICNALNVSRRTLHRAFHEVLGIGPVTFLQRKRLCDIHSVLRDSDPAATTIAEVAMEHGFLNLGRFSGYYRSLFGEYPSETIGTSRRNKRLLQSN